MPAFTLGQAPTLFVRALQARQTDRSNSSLARHTRDAFPEDRLNRAISVGPASENTFSAIDRLIFVCLYRLLPGVRDALAIVKPETVVKWYRAGFR
jgi:hypothetical protein